MDAVERAAALRAYAEETAGCTRCALSQGRTQVVFGSGSPDADLMFVGEAPGFHEDQQGVPFVGQAGKLLDTAARRDRVDARRRVRRERPQVPPAREPRPAAGRDRVLRAAPVPSDRADQPKLVATLGNFATKLLSGKPAGITRVHGYEQEVTLGGADGAALPDLPSGGRALHARRC